MGQFAMWMWHRMRCLGFERGADLAGAAGTEPKIVYAICDHETLDGIDRSTCRHIADALRVSLRRMEKLSEGLIDWIEDGDVTYPDRPGVLVVDDEWPPREVPAKERRGVPDLGWIFEERGKIDVDDWWDDAFGPRLRFILRSYPRAYSFRVGFRGDDPQWRVFRDVPAYTVQVGQTVAAYISDNGVGEGVYGMIKFLGIDKVGFKLGEEVKEFKAEHVVRVGKLMYTHAREDVQLPAVAEAA